MVFNGTLFYLIFYTGFASKDWIKSRKKALRTKFKKLQWCEKGKFFKRETSSDEPAFLKKYGVKENKDQ